MPVQFSDFAAFVRHNTLLHLRDNADTDTRRGEARVGIDCIHCFRALLSKSLSRFESPQPDMAGIFLSGVRRAFWLAQLDTLFPYRVCPTDVQPLLPFAGICLMSRYATVTCHLLAKQLPDTANWNCRAVSDLRVANLAAKKQSLMSARSLKGKCVPTAVKLLS